MVILLCLLWFITLHPRPTFFCWQCNTYVFESVLCAKWAKRALPHPFLSRCTCRAILVASTSAQSTKSSSTCATMSSLYDKATSFVAKYFRIVDTMDANLFASELFESESTFKIGSYPPALGHSQISAAANAVFNLLSAIRHDVASIRIVDDSKCRCTRCP